MKLVGNTAIALDDDPRPMERIQKNRLKLMIFSKTVDPAWGCVLYQLEIEGRITNEQKDAGDKYWRLAHEYEALMQIDPEELIPGARELAYKRIERVKKRYRDVVECLGTGRKYVDWVVFEELWPSGEAGHSAALRGLELLRIFFNTGTKRVRRRA